MCTAISIWVKYFWEVGKCTSRNQKLLYAAWLLKLWVTIMLCICRYTMPHFGLNLKQCIRWGLLKNKLMAGCNLPTTSLFFWAAQITFQKCLGTHQMFWLKAIMNFDKIFHCFVFYALMPAHFLAPLQTSCLPKQRVTREN